ncbi:MAG: TolB family protein [Actinomycetota bacterium]
MAFLTVVATVLFGALGIAEPAQAKVPGPNGRIAFFRNNAGDNRATLTYTVNPDGSHELPLFGGTDNEHPHWAPNGIDIAIEVDSLGGSAVIVNSDTGSYRVLQRPDPTLDLGCLVWSPDGSRLACAGFDDADPSREGVYTVRASDGGDLTRITGFVGIPGDYSPDGTRLSFVGVDEDDQLRIFVVGLNGSGLTPVTPAGMSLNDEEGGSWSPTADSVLFQARPAPDHRYALWTVNADGSDLRRLPVPGCGGAFSDPRSIGCGDPVWSPDGSKIAFVRISAKTRQKNIYTVNADGSGLFQVTRTGFQDFGPDWGVHPPVTGRGN